MAESAKGPESGWSMLPLPEKGVLVAGLYTSSDPTLEEKYKLPILTNGDLYTRTTYAGVWAYATFAHMSPNARNLLTSGAMACVLYGLCGFVEQDKDGDWREEATARSEFTQLPPKDTHCSKSLLTALDIIIATKANWWTKNCHTGSGIMIGHVNKYPYKDFSKAAQTMGHWASTIKILSVAGIKGLRTFTAVGLPGEQELIMSKDAKLSFSLLPAGTHRLAVAYEATVKLLQTQFTAMCPSVEDFMIIPDIYSNIKETPASYHMRAQYLAGKLGNPTFTAFRLPGEQELTMSKDAKLSFSLLPAGTQRLAVAYEAAVKLLQTQFAAMCPSVEDFMIIPDIYSKIKETPASYHMKAQYLTGKPRADYDDCKIECYLGRLGTFITSIFPGSSLARTPHFARNKLQDYLDYDIIFENVLAVHKKKIREEFHKLQDTLGVHSPAGKSKGEGNKVGEPLLHPFMSTEEAVRKVRDAFGIPIAADKGEEKSDDNDENGGGSSV